MCLLLVLVEHPGLKLPSHESEANLKKIRVGERERSKEFALFVPLLVEIRPWRLFACRELGWAAF